MQVVGLVGASGTGKSHRASLIASQEEVDAIIDDGLLIRGSRILAGSSAKREPTSLAATRRAIFSDPGHAANVRRALKDIDPERLLVLGTSRRMVHRITERLQLPQPQQMVDIEDVATPEEIQEARAVRENEGKHVIPAPTFEVKKGFSGYLVDPLRLFHRGRQDRALVIEKSVVQPTFSSLGKFFIMDSVVAAIVRRTSREVPGTVAVHKTAVDMREIGVILRVHLDLAHGHVLHKVLRQAQLQVSHAVEHMTALNVLEIHVECRRVVPRERRAPVQNSGSGRSGPVPAADAPASPDT